MLIYTSDCNDGHGHYICRIRFRKGGDQFNLGNKLINCINMYDDFNIWDRKTVPLNPIIYIMIPVAALTFRIHHQMIPNIVTLVTRTGHLKFCVRSLEIIQP